MNRDSLYSSNVSVLLAIIFFVGLSSDVFAGSATSYMMSLFGTSALILLIVVVCCSISLACLFVGDIFPINGVCLIYLNKSALIFLFVEVALLIFFTIRFVMFNLKSIGWSF